MIIKETIAAGKDATEALENGKKILGLGDLDDVKFSIIDNGTKGILGLFSRPAKVRVYVEGPDEEQACPERRERQNRDRREVRKPQGKPQSKPENAEGTEGEEQKPQGNQQKNGAKKNNKNRNRNRNQGNRRPTEEQLKAAREEASKPRSVVIPETELKMEQRFVEDGEDMSFDFIKTVIKDIGLNAEAALYGCDDGTRRITISGEDASTLIGHHGDTLDALQYLANLASARKNAKGERDKSRVTLDIEGYRAKREATLRALARRKAETALRNNRSVMLEPMSAYERRIIHSEIQGIEGVSTNSIGSDNNRKIVIYLTDKKPEGIFEEDETVEQADSLTEELVSGESNEEHVDVEESLSVESTEDSEVVAVEVTRPDETEDADSDEDDK